MIIGERIRLRAMRRDDLPLFVEWFNDPEVTR
jgi:RimJ/RimL family protein N-acetyltransferase